MTLLTVKAAIQSLAGNSDTGAFDLLLSNAALDRQGDSLSPDAWVQPLPDTVPLNVDHSKRAADIVGSGQPWLDADGNLRVSGTFASSPQAQHIRSLVTEGHLRGVSVEFLRHKRRDGRAVHELVGGAFVNVPANPEARVLAAKSAEPTAPAWFTEALARMAAGEDPDTVIQDAHDATGLLGATCQAVTATDDLDADETGDDDGANKAAALRLRAKALSL